jgi:hypothetical protein
MAYINPTSTIEKKDTKAERRRERERERNTDTTLRD